MDEKLLAMLGKTKAEEIKFVNGATGEIEFPAAEGRVKYALQPLAELYGSGLGVSSVEPLDERFEPLFMCIERAIVDHYLDDSDLTDGRVALTLDRMAANPATDPLNDALCRAMQSELRLYLSLHNHSRHEVVQAIRKIGKSVERHTKVAGIRGYLNFIRGFMP